MVTEARLSRTQAANALLNTRRTLAGYNRITRHPSCCCTDKVEHEPSLSTSSLNNKTSIMLSFVLDALLVLKSQDRNTIEYDYGLLVMFVVNNADQECARSQAWASRQYATGRRCASCTAVLVDWAKHARSRGKQAVRGYDHHFGGFVESSMVTNLKFWHKAPERRSLTP